MTREIKFRGVTAEGCWLYGSLVWIPNYEPHIQFTEYASARVVPESIGQYTGLKDKAGVEIYEGDKVRVRPSGALCEIRWTDGMFVWKDPNDNEHIMNSNMTKNRFEVVGNIYEQK